MAWPEKCTIAFRRRTVCRLVLQKTKEFKKKYFFNLRLFISLHTTRFTTMWPVRLSVRTPGFQPGKRGSIPLRATIALNLLIKEENQCRSLGFFELFNSIIFANMWLRKRSVHSSNKFIQLDM